MYIFNSCYLLHSYNPSFLICLFFNMVSFRGQKKAWVTPRSVSFRGLIQNFRRANPSPFICGVPPPGPRLENEAPKTRNHCRLNDYNFKSCMTQAKPGGGNGCVGTSKGPPIHPTEHLFSRLER